MIHVSLRACTFIVCAVMSFTGMPFTTALQALANPTLLKAAATMYATAQVGALARDWCLVNAPSERPLIEKEYAAWRASFGLPSIESYLQTNAAPQLAQLRAAVDERRDQVYAELSRASQNPVTDCRNIRAQLTSQINLPVLLPQEYQLTSALRASMPAPAPSAPVSASATAPAPSAERSRTFLTTTRFDPVSATYVQGLLGKAGGQPPYQGGGTLKTGAYECVQQNTHNFEDLLSVVSYTLTLYPDLGLRFTDGTFTGADTKTAEPLKAFQATYSYDRPSGNLEIETDYTNYDLKDYMYGNGRYDGVGDDPPLFNIFRVLTDAHGQSLIYGQKGYGYRDGDLTVCRYQGAAKGLSPVAQARQAAQAEVERFNRYRLKPDAGLKLNQIEGLLHTYENQYDGINVIGRESTTLLLKDGTAYLNLRWSPHDLDVAASRNGEPQAWTKWRRQGGGYELLSAGHWTSLNGTLGVPAGQNEVLSGSYQFISSYTSGTLMNGATATTREAYTFTSGRQYSQTSSSGVAGTLNTGAMVTTSAASSPADFTSGTYVFKGYTLEFRSRSGQTSRTYAFFWTKDKKSLMIGGQTYTRE
ncbi:hypothetical protein [Deinococcus ruber]|uniref:Uncharacterized protein n=1 Tax=Deinococcus ruber TaxID=1848197 RepID=A0A918FFD6_9DEIO|nr:hypothetical protein [Deinococcus ruber]GGR34681.1 hypothetical protein GCM10008957_50940 [Deinococcus ruber]